MNYDLLDNLTPIYIYGAGEIAKLTEKKLNENGFSIEGFVVDDDYKSDNYISKTDLCTSNKSYILFRGNYKSFFISDDDFLREWNGCKAIYQINNIYDETVEPLTNQFYLNNKDSFDRVRNALEDDLSKLSFDAYINSKINNDIIDTKYVITPQYFFEPALWSYTDYECLVDCGAYDGDSIHDYYNIVNKDKSHVIAFEPDNDNLRKLYNRINKENYNNVTVIEAGAGEQKGTLFFDTTGSMLSKVSECGSEKIEIDTIDNVVGDNKATIIKMDIEGSELSALLGARNTIKRDHPILAICVYHKKDDLFRIYDTIKSIYPDYKFYIRNHKIFAIDVVLYAVPYDRTI